MYHKHQSVGTRLLNISTRPINFDPRAFSRINSLRNKYIKCAIPGNPYLQLILQNLEILISIFL